MVSLLFKLVMLLKYFKLPVIAVIPIFFSIYLYYNNSSENHSLLNRSEYYIGVIGDEADGGSSEVSGGYIGNNSYELVYTLLDGYEYPYATIYLSRYNNGLIDFSKFDCLNIAISSENSEFLEIKVYLYIEGKTHIDDHSTYLPISYILPVESLENEYRVELDKFEIPHWWFSSKSYFKVDNIEDHLDSVIYFQVGPVSDKELGREDRIILSDLILTRSNLRLVPIIVPIVIIYTLLIVLLNKLLQTKKAGSIKYKKIDIDNDSKSMVVIEEYIGTNYSDSNLCLLKVSEDLKIGQKSISEYIHNSFKMNFPSYLNLIRITEAKRILSSSDIKILDIALAVGYNSAGHFNRIFKQLEGMTPTEYRKKSKK